MGESETEILFPGSWTLKSRPQRPDDSPDGCIIVAGVVEVQPRAVQALAGELPVRV